MSHPTLCLRVPAGAEPAPPSGIKETDGGSAHEVGCLDSPSPPCTEQGIHGHPDQSRVR